MHKVCHCSRGGGGGGGGREGGAGGEEMNETTAIFSFCFSEDEFVKKISDRLKKTIERAE